MGLLTDPTDKDKPIRLILAHHNKVNVLAYITGAVWFALLAYQPFNANTYFSENALLPGLVARSFKGHRSSDEFLRELNNECQQKKQEAPFNWLFAKFYQLGLDVNLQNFTLRNPFGNKKKLFGQNLYAILRAPRAASTEALILSTSFRPVNGGSASNNPGIALMYSLAQFFQDHTYWAKDIIFLITEHENIGFQAWLDAYHQSEISSSVLDVGKIMSRSGSIQAAINLEIHSSTINGIDIKIEGLNGQLPNLDLFNLIVELCKREDLIATFQKRHSYWDSESFENWKRSMKTLASMIGKQASGTPSGGHGLFHRYGIQALTLESFTTRSSSKAGFYEIGRVLEGLFRSLNNLLEKFHQSFFFYLLPSKDQYISIGLYMPPFALIALPILIKAAALWLQAIKSADQQNADFEAKKIKEDQMIDYSLAGVIPIYFFVHCLGILLTMAPSKFDDIRSNWDFPVDDAIFTGLISTFCSLLAYPIFLKKQIKGRKSWEILKCITFLELSVIMFALAMMNFSLGLCLTIIYTPICYIITPSPSRIVRILKGILLLLISPLVLLYLVIVAHVSLNTTASQNIFKDSLNLEKKLVVESIEDSLIYGNWTFQVICCFIIPTWLLLWSLLHQCFVHEIPLLNHKTD